MGNSLKEKLLNLDEENLCNYITELTTKLSTLDNGNSNNYQELNTKILNLGKESLYNYITELKTKLSMSDNGNSTKCKELRDKLLLAVTCLPYVKKNQSRAMTGKNF